jgi:hypothetical protein
MKFGPALRTLFGSGLWAGRGLARRTSIGSPLATPCRMKFLESECWIRVPLTRPLPMRHPAVDLSKKKKNLKKMIRQFG